VDFRLVIIDESGKQAYAVDRMGYDSSINDKVFLGRRGSFSFDAGAADSPEQIKRIEMLKRAKIYVFAASFEDAPMIVELPPP